MIALILVGIVLGACSIASVLSLVNLATRMAPETTLGLQCVDQFVQAGSRQDYASAIRLTTGPDITTSDLTDLFTNHRELFSGYKQAESQNVQLNDMNGRLFLNLQGNLRYDDGHTLPFTARLEKATEWRIVAFHISLGK